MDTDTDMDTDMEITQDSILSLLVGEGGKIKNAELLKKFKGALNCSDPVEKKQRRDLFKMIINNLAVVKEKDEVKYIVLRKKYQHLVKLRSEEENVEEEGGGVDPETVELNPGSEERQEAPEVPEENKSEQKCPSDREAVHAPTFIEQTLQRQTSFRVKKSLDFRKPVKQGADETQKDRPAGFITSQTLNTPRRFALPLRIPPVIVTPETREEVNELKIPSNENNPVKVHLASVNSTPGPPSSPRYKRRSSVDSVGVSSSPQPRRHCKSVKPTDEPKYSDIVPLESSEHKWTVASASGHWGLVYGLLLDDTQLAEKKDFISGFTALHWAAKCGNYDMLCKIIDLSRKNGKGVDVNTKSYAGYTPLHIAAIHRQEYIIGILVNEYKANCNVRDNSGKKAHHYLDKDASLSIRELLGGVKLVHPEPQRNSEDPDTHKHTHTISRLFQPQTIGYKKKPKSRNSLWSLAEDVKDEKGEHSNPMHRVFSDVFS